MTHYHLYIKAGLEIDSTTRFYKVGIGQSERQSRLYTWLEAFAAEHGHFFALWNNDAAEFYAKCCDSIGHDAAPLIITTAEDLKKTLKNGCENPALWQAFNHRHKLLMKIDPNYYFYYQLSKRKKKDI